MVKHAVAGRFAAVAAALDVYGNKRLFGGIYDIGCHERLVPGLMLLLR